LLRILDKLIGLPPTAKKLAALSLPGFRQAASGEFAQIDTAAVKSALGYLQGRQEIASEPLPEVQAYRAGEMPESIRVACASNRGEMLDGHFGSCLRFLIYQVSEAEIRLIDIRQVDEDEQAEDKNGYRASLIDDCQILFVGSIGGPAAAKVIRAGVHPLKKPLPGPAREELQALRQVIGKQTPPWLAKIMGRSAQARARCTQVGG
jgi:nitrogen fixation protein NifX